jgi:hypothetical protein
MNTLKSSRVWQFSPRKNAENWQCGYRVATYINPSKTPQIKSESTHGHIINLRKILRITMATTNIRNNLASYAQLKQKAQECSSLKPQKKMNYAEQAMEVMELVIVELVDKVEGMENESCTTR